MHTLAKLAASAVTGIALAVLISPELAAADPGNTAGPNSWARGTVEKGKSGWAVIDAKNATIVRGKNTVSANNNGKAEYDVIFNSNVSGCAFSGTVGLTGSSGTSPPGYITVVGDSGNSDGVFVQVFNANGKPAAHDFHLIVMC